MQYRVTKEDKVLKGVVELEGSKSITNRVLIIKALCEDFFNLKNFSRSDDSNTLFELINSREKVLNAKDGGTTLRFLTAHLAVHEGEVIVTGSDRLIDRPIGPLVEALTTLGADIQYLGKQDFPPILIRGKRLKENKVEVESGISSQFISALLLIAPVLKNGLILKLKGEVVSRPYIQMTLDLMKQFGISSNWSQNIISISHQDYTPRDCKVEGDWSAASYWYLMAAFSDEVDLKIIGLHKISYQGDAVITKIMEEFGVSTTFIDNGIHITKKDVRPKKFNYDFIDCPDLAQTLFTACAGLHIPAVIKGISNLQIKETDRIGAMRDELAKLNVNLEAQDNQWVLNSGPGVPSSSLSFNTYNDHRMAMALTPLAIPYGSVVINDPGVVSKSYPSFWSDLKNVGFEIEEIG